MTALNTADRVRFGPFDAHALRAGSSLAWPPLKPVVTLTIPAGKVASTLTNFVVRVDLSTMPAGWWAAGATDGSNVRVKSGGTVIPFDLVNYAPALRRGDLFFKATLTTGASTFTVEQVSGAAALAVTDPNGRNAVWSDYDEVYIGSATSRNGSGHNLTLSNDAAFMPYVSRQISPNVTAHQGFARNHEADEWVVIGTDELVRYDSTWTEVARSATPVADSGVTDANHIGDGCICDGELFAPLTKYPVSGALVETIGVWDAITLAFKRSHDISAYGDTLAGICWDRDGERFAVIRYNTTSGTPSILTFDKDFDYLGAVTLSAAISYAQGITYTHGDFYVTADASDANVPLLRVMKVTPAGTVTEGWRSRLSNNIEGIDSNPYDGTLYVHFTTTGDTDSRVYEMKPAASNWLSTAKATAAAKATVSVARTAWTFGASITIPYLSSATGYNFHQAVFSYGTTDNTTAAQMLVRNVSPRRIGIWNSTNSWLEDTSASADPGARHRYHHTQNGTTDRKIWRNGVARATQAAPAQRPTAASVLGLLSDPSATGAAANQIFWAQGNYFYLRNGVLSADWIAAEYASWESPATFYALS